MRFALMIEAQQGLSYEDQLAIVQPRRGGRLRVVLPERPLRRVPGRRAISPTTDAWAVLAGLARETSRITLGALVSPVTFRHPGNFVKLVTTVDQMSGGRIEVGVGAGWNDDDHEQLGLAVPADRRARRPDGGPARAPARPVDGGARLDVRRAPGPRSQRRAAPGPGARSTAGRARTAERAPGSSPAARARRVASGSPPAMPTSSTSRRQRRTSRGRSSASSTRPARRPVATRRRSPARRWSGTLIGRDERRGRAPRRRAPRRVRRVGDGRARLAGAAARSAGSSGTPDEARAMVGRFAEAGIERIMLQDFLPHDLDHIDLMAEELIGKV